MLSSILDISINELNEINSHRDDSFTNSFNIIPLVEIDDYVDVYPFSSCKFHIILKKPTSDINKSRKYKEDDIRKKLKASFLKVLRKIINVRLNKAGSKYLLEYFPQLFVTDITQKTNFEIMELTFEKLFDYTYNQLKENEKNVQREDYIKKRNAAALKKYKKNIEALEYLNSNRKISEESGWEIIKNMKCIDLLRAYFNSLEFQQTVKELSKKETNDYINSYIYFASTYVDFFLSYQPNEKKRNNNSKRSKPLRKNNFPALNIPLPSPFPPSIFDIEEIENFIPESFHSIYDDYSLTNDNSLFINGNFLLNEISFN